MSNMSYCRFENTSGDLQDCINAVGEMIEGGHDLRDQEQRAFARMIEQAVELLQLVGDAVGMSVEELCEKVHWNGDSLVEDFRTACGGCEGKDDSKA